MKRALIAIPTLFAGAVLLAQVDPTSGRLLRQSDLVYQGAFRLPKGAASETSFEYGGTALAYYPAHDSLFLVGHAWHQRVAEVSIPGPIKANAVDRLPVATLRQPFVDVLEGRRQKIGEGSTAVGGMLVSGNTLIVSAFLFYDGSGSQMLSQFRSGLDLARPGDVEGPFQIGALGAGFVSGYMAPIPPEWQAALGGPALAGNCCLSVIGRTSSGPAASVFSPADLGVKHPAPAQPVVGYPLDHATIGAWGKDSPLFNGPTQVTGLVFPHSSRSVLFFGRHGLGTFCYGSGGATGGDCVDPAESSKGSHAYPYAYQVWAYDVLDLVAVKNGKKKPWDIRPYATWNFDLPFEPVNRQIKGAAYDPATKRIFLSAAFSDDTAPLIHVFGLTPAAPPSTEARR